MCSGPVVNEPAFQFDICNQYMQLYYVLCILYTLYVSVIICMHISSFIQSGQQIIMSVKRALSIALTADGAQPILESLMLQ